MDSAIQWIYKGGKRHLGYHPRSPLPPAAPDPPTAPVPPNTSPPAPRAPNFHHYMDGHDDGYDHGKGMDSQDDGTKEHDYTEGYKRWV